MTRPHDNGSGERPERDDEITMPLVPEPPQPDAAKEAARDDAAEQPVDLEQTVRLDKATIDAAAEEPDASEGADKAVDADDAAGADDADAGGRADAEPGPGSDAEPSDATETEAGAGAETDQTPPVRPKRKVSSAGIVIAVLVGLLGFALIVQVRGTSTDSTLASARTDDLVRILSDLDSSEDRLRQEIGDLEQLKRELTAGSESAEAARKAAEERADELGILAGTLPAKGPGLVVRFSGPIRASRMLDAVEELRNAGAEAMQVTGANGQSVRIIVSTWFQDGDGGLNVSGTKLTGPYTITVIGDPATMKTALNIPGGVVATVSSDGGNVIVEDPGTVTVSVLAAEPNLQYAQPAS